MRAAGFGDQQVADYYYENRPDIYLDPIFERLQSDPQFLSRLQASQRHNENSSAPRPAQPLEFLYEMVGIQWDIPVLCEKISPNSLSNTLNGNSVSLRAACYSYIAFNRRDDALCHKLPPAQDPLPANHASASSD